MESIPFVSIVMITYNHEKFIKQAIEGVLMQQCNFKVELIIANDNSPDETDKIILEVIKNHPNSSWVKYTNHSKNKGMMNNFIWSLGKAQGKYIALCEGDDYWTDPLKLQKQVDFLEANKDYSLCFTNRINYNQNTKIFEKSKPIDKFDFSFKEYLDKAKNGIITATATSMFRTNIFNTFDLNEFIYYLKNSFAGDTFLFSIILTTGKGKILKDITTVYRITGKGASSKFTNPIRYKIRMVTLSFLLDKNLIKDKSDKEFVQKRLKELKFNYVKNKVLTLTNKMGINTLYKKILNK